MVEAAAKIWLDGTLVEWEMANVHILTHSLHYGSGMFEGIRAYQTERGPAVFRLDDHLRRLYRTASIYLTVIPFSLAEMREAIHQLIGANGLGDCYIRPIVFRGAGEMGLNLDLTRVQVGIVAWRWDTYLGADAVNHGARATISSWRRHDPNVIPPAAKGTGQYMNSVLASTEAKRAGFDEAIMLNLAGNVAEGAGENVFLVQEGGLLTPPESSGILPGITRDTVIQLAVDMGHEVRQRDVVRSDLYVSDELFFCGTGAEITAIREVDNRSIGNGDVPGPLTRAIAEAFAETVRGRTPAHADWLDYVDEH